MNETFATIIHAAPKMDVKELEEVKTELATLFDKDFVKECKTNKDLINKVVRENIDPRKPEEGEVGLRMYNLAQERNINYKPSNEVMVEIKAYCQRKCIPVPTGLRGPDVMPIAPQYMLQPTIQSTDLQSDGAPRGGPPSDGYGGGMDGGIGGGSGSGVSYSENDSQKRLNTEP